MSADSVEIASDEYLCLLDELRRLLNRQIVMVRKGDFRESETLLSESGRIVDELAGLSASEPIEFREQFEQVAESYRQIIFMVEVEKNRLEPQLRQVGQARKTLKVYHGRD